MEGTDLSIDTDVLRDLGVEIIKMGEEYLSEEGKLYREIERVHTNWQGDDSTEYYNGVKSYETDIKTLGDTIVSIGNHLKNTSGEHETRIGNFKSSAKKLFANI
jgi:uncharacterized protein YukE